MFFLCYRERIDLFALLSVGGVKIVSRSLEAKFKKRCVGVGGSGVIEMRRQLQTGRDMRLSAVQR